MSDKQELTDALSELRQVIPAVNDGPIVTAMLDNASQKRVDLAVAAVNHLFTNGSLKTLPTIQLRALATILAAELHQRESNP